METGRNDSVGCAEPGCLSFCFDPGQAVRQGWVPVREELFCPDHGYVRASRARREDLLAEMRAKIERRAGKRHDREAKRWLTTREYAAWAEFQQALTNFQKENGRLARPELRMLQPQQWAKIYRNSGAIDVVEAQGKLEEAEAKAAATKDWLLRREHGI